jgi:hypothetical protein
MSTLTFVDQKRAGSVIKSNIFVQIDETAGNDKVTTYIGGAAPKFDHFIYVDAVFDVQNRDQFTDRNTDASGIYNTYRVAGKPEFFDQTCMEIPCELIVGTP